MTLTVGSTYAGAIDAFGYAVNQINILWGGKYVLEWQIELERKAHIYLNKNYPNTKRYYYDEWHHQYKLQPVDIICGGDPCQPHSTAGNQQGQSDYRFRWPFMLNLIKEQRPAWIINENVTGSISNLVLDRKIADLEKIGYACQPYIIPAVACGAKHIRNRVFLIANSNVQRRRELLHTDVGAVFKTCQPANTLGTQRNVFLQFEESEAQSPLLSMDDGIPDHVFRLGAAGNSIYANIPIILLTAIYEIEKQLRK
jgi:DNA (cytosine-5)-methyltransferase 1